MIVSWNLAIFFFAEFGATKSLASIFAPKKPSLVWIQGGSPNPLTMIECWRPIGDQCNKEQHFLG